MLANLRPSPAPPATIFGSVSSFPNRLKSSHPVRHRAGLPTPGGGGGAATGAASHALTRARLSCQHKLARLAARRETNEKSFQLTDIRAVAMPWPPHTHTTMAPHFSRPDATTQWQKGAHNRTGDLGAGWAPSSLWPCYTVRWSSATQILFLQTVTGSRRPAAPLVAPNHWRMAVKHGRVQPAANAQHRRRAHLGS